MIPDFDERGNLPPGIYDSTIDEVLSRFNMRNNLTRRKRSEALEAFYRGIEPFVTCVYIDGSYITTKLSPGDVDIACVFIPGFDFHTTGLLLMSRLQRYMKDIHFFRYKDDNDLRLLNLVSEWRKDRDGNPKGIIRIRNQR